MQGEYEERREMKQDLAEVCEFLFSTKNEGEDSQICETSDTKHVEKEEHWLDGGALRTCAAAHCRGAVTLQLGDTSFLAPLVRVFIEPFALHNRLGTRECFLYGRRPHSRNAREKHKRVVIRKT